MHLPITFVLERVLPLWQVTHELGHERRVARLLDLLARQVLRLTLAPWACQAHRDIVVHAHIEEDAILRDGGDVLTREVLVDSAQLLIVQEDQAHALRIHAQEQLREC